MYTTQHNNTLIEHTHNYTYKMDTATAAAITLTHHISSLGTVSQSADQLTLPVTSATQSTTHSTYSITSLLTQTPTHYTISHHVMS